MRSSKPIALLVAVLVVLPCFVAVAKPVAVRYPEGVVQSYLVLRSADGQALALGELRQVPRDQTIESRMTFAFKDGSRHEETVTYAQREVFRLVSYRVRQRGPAFPTVLDASLDGTGRYRIVWRGKDEGEKVDEGRLDLPTDVYNGMTILILKNLGKAEAGTVHVVAFGPKPRLVELKLAVEGEDPFVVAGERKTATRYVGKPDLGALGVLAKLIGKHPPDYHFWLVRGQPPGFLAFEGPLYLDGPIWRVETTTPTWPAEQTKRP